ncbi:hypothetical protein [Cutibacterium avidum]|uniref:hypothetical protein n=2 Tax=Cutibacterium avidum TaxID=33010 RepID=UPI002FEEAB92
MAMSALILTLLLTLFNFIGFVLQQVWNFIAGFFHALFLLVVSPREGAMHLGMWFCRYGGLVCIGYGVWVIGRHAHLSEIATREWVLAGVLVGGGLLLRFIAAGIDGELENRAEEEALERQARKLKEVMLRDDL